MSFNEGNLHDRCEQLEALVRDLDFCIGISMCCDQCPIRPCRMVERMRKLGIERRKVDA